MEKPAGRNLADTAEIAEAVHVAGVQSAVGFNYRHAPAIQRARELVGAGRIGRVETVRTFLSSDYAAHPDGALSWRFDPQYAGTGVLGDLASHGLDLAAYVLGEQRRRRHRAGGRPGDVHHRAARADSASSRTSRRRAAASAARSATRTRSRCCSATRRAPAA